MLVFLTVLIMLAVGYAQYRNGLFSAMAMCVMVLLAGLVAFNFWEPLADLLEPTLQNGSLAGTEDMLVLVGLFCLTLAILRAVTNRLAPVMIEYHGAVQLVGAGLIGMIAGYLVSGFLLCALQTLPLDERFLGFEPRREGEPRLRSLFPADRVWLALMRHAGAYPLHTGEGNPDAEYPYDRYRTFDRDGTFELRYQRYRRHAGSQRAQPYNGELDREIYRKSS